MRAVMISVLVSTGTTALTDFSSVARGIWVYVAMRAAVSGASTNWTNFGAPACVPGRGLIAITAFASYCAGRREM